MFNSHLEKVYLISFVKCARAGRAKLVLFFAGSGTSDSCGSLHLYWWTFVLDVFFVASSLACNAIPPQV